MKKLLLTFKYAFNDARKNLFHTLLSVLGMVIGVAALVGILSLIDGMENFAHDQITKTTSLESIVVNSKTTDRTDGIVVKRKQYDVLSFEAYQQLSETVEETSIYLKSSESGYIGLLGDTVEHAAVISGILHTWNDRLELKEGRFLTENDLEKQLPVVVLNDLFASKLADSTEWGNLLGKLVPIKGDTMEIVGIIAGYGSSPQIMMPLTRISKEDQYARPPRMVLIASSVEQVPQIKQQVESWIEGNFDNGLEGFTLNTNEYRVAQANQGFLIFRIVMGLIVGISVLVGGVGVMNVLLISVTERTAEIGVRMAVGAKRKDIVAQFLSESLTISFIGSLLGLIAGVLLTMIAVPVIQHFSEMPFSAAYTLDTFLIILSVALLIGISFGTYPAIKASRLDPVEAIRRE